MVLGKKDDAYKAYDKLIKAVEADEDASASRRCVGGPRLRCVWSFRHLSTGKDQRFPFKLPAHGSENAKRTVGISAATGSVRRCASD
jgi:hypothetical protein